MANYKGQHKNYDLERKKVTNESKKQSKGTLGAKITLSFLLIIILTIGTLSTIMYSQSYNMLVNNLAKRSIKIAEYASTKIDIEEFNKLKTVEDEKKEAYKIMKGILGNIKQTAGAKYIYTMRKNDAGKYYYVIDGTSLDNKDVSHIGDVEEIVEEGYEKANNGEPYQSRKIQISSWGTLVSSYYPLKDKTGKVVGIICVDYDVEAEYNALLKYRMQVIVIALGLLTLTALLGIILSKKIANPIVKVTSLLNKTANLDLVYDASYEPLLNYNDEIGSMVYALFETRKELRTLITTISERSINIDSQTEILSTVSQEMAASSENVTTSIQSITQGTNSQSVDLANTADILNQFGRELTNIVEKIKTVDSNAREMHFMADKSSYDMQSMVKSLNKMTNSFKDFITKISGLGENINHINEITNVINGIANQTNLLALNASIEAARAGEAGKGFTVVAEEIRKLAEQSRISSQNINSLIMGISKDTNIMLNTTDAMDNELNSQAAVINIAIDSFKQIIGSLEEVIPQIDEVSISAINIESKKHIILEKVENVCSASQEVSACSEEIAASSEEMTASTDEVASAAQELSSMTKRMMEAISKFKL